MTTSENPTEYSHYWLKLKQLVVTVLIFRLVLAFLIPMTGDEAYFVLWANHLAFGYYDHPPAVAWLIAPMLRLFGKSEIAVRFPAILYVPLMMWFLFDLVWRAGLGARRAFFSAVVVSLYPIFWLTVAITTDTPLFLFGLIFFYAFARQIIAGELIWFFTLLAGAALFLSVQSKYFFVLLCLAFLISVTFLREQKYFKILFITAIFAISSGLLHLWWNATHCYSTILFNFINRQQVNDHWPDTMIAFIAMSLWLMLPLMHRSMLKRHSAPLADYGIRLRNTALVFWLVPIIIFLIVATGREVGLHYVITFLPFLLLWFFLRVTDTQMGEILLLSKWISGVHLILFLAILFMPLNMIKDKNILREALAHYYPNEVLQKFDQQDIIVGAENYSISAVVAFHDPRNRHWVVWGEGSFHARQDDFITNWSALNGKNFAILAYSPMNETNFSRYFERVENVIFNIHGSEYHQWRGYGFNYPLYRKEKLLPALKANYSRPAWLHSFGCPLEQKFGIELVIR